MGSELRHQLKQNRRAAFHQMLEPISCHHCVQRFGRLEELTAGLLKPSAAMLVSQSQRGRYRAHIHVPA